LSVGTAGGAAAYVTFMRMNMQGAVLGGLLLVARVVLAQGAAAPAFAVASIRPSAEAVKFEHDGITETTPGSVHMRDVTVATCITWAYGIQHGQLSGPAWIEADHFDIMAKADEPVKDEQLKLMMRALLEERFKLAFHHDQKEMRAYVLTVTKTGQKLKQAAADEVPLRQNSAMGSVVRALTMQEFADFISGPLQRPVVDKTGLTGRWDFAFDFTNYLPKTPEGERPDFEGVLNATLQGEVGLKLESEKTMVEVLVVDRVEKPSPN
jgi:uncharacterized protein (TIGR03435 family)